MIAAPSGARRLEEHLAKQVRRLDGDPGVRDERGEEWVVARRPAEHGAAG
jgi:hypothetical protein